MENGSFNAMAGQRAKTGKSVKITGICLALVWAALAAGMYDMADLTCQGLWMEESPVKLFVMACFGIPLALVGLIAALILKVSSRKRPRAGRKVFWANYLSACLVSSMMLTVGLIAPISGNDYFAAGAAILLFAAFLIAYLVGVTAYAKRAGREGAVCLLICFLLSFLPAIILGFGLTSALVWLAQWKLLIVLALLCVMGGGSRCVIVWVKIIG